MGISRDCHDFSIMMNNGLDLHSADICCYSEMGFFVGVFGYLLFWGFLGFGEVLWLVGLFVCFFITVLCGKKLFLFSYSAQRLKKALLEVVDNVTDMNSGLRNQFSSVSMYWESRNEYLP